MSRWYVPVIIVSTLACSVTVGDEARFERLLENFDWRLEQRSATDRIMHTPEAEAILSEGVAILPRLVERIRAMNGVTPRVESNYGALVLRISGIMGFPYTLEPKKIGLIDFYESDIDNLPPYSYNVLEFHVKDSRAKFLKYWDMIAGLDDPSDRVTTMRSITRDIDPMAETLTAARWREYERAMGSLGIFNLPVYIEQVKVHNDPVAFAEFLRVTSHPFYWQSGFKAIHVHIERVQEAANEFPKDEERIELILDWWERCSDQFLAFPALHSAIEVRLQAVVSE